LIEGKYVLVGFGFGLCFLVFFFPAMRVFKHCYWLPRAALESPFLGDTKNEAGEDQNN